MRRGRTTEEDFPSQQLKKCIAFALEYGKKDFGVEVETVEACGNDVKNPYSRRRRILSVVQTSVEVTESSLPSLEMPIYGSLKGNTHKL